MEIYGDLNMNQGEIIDAAVKVESTFPTTPVNGQIAFIVNKLYMALETSPSVFSWIPISNELDALVYTQGAAALSWVIDTSSFDDNNITVTIYDENDKQIIPDDIDVGTADQVTVTFSVAQDGKAVLVHRMAIYD